ncbi:C39 family peptidase [Noviherbaspirillum sedimenti]|nr:C39 family peptidase [Noviherbaspirillum sedimenti]
MLAASLADAAKLHFSGIGGGYSVPVTSMKESRFSSTLRQQYDFSCGSAAIATLLTHQYGVPVTEEMVFQTMYEHGDQAKIRREGFSLLDMKRYLAAYGFTADGFTQPLDKLVEAGLPAIVLINDKGYHHFVVVKGLRDGRVLIGDPATGTRAVERASFEASWVNRVLFVIHNRQEQARFNLVADWGAAPRAPLAAGVRREGLESVTLPKFGSTDF